MDKIFGLCSFNSYNDCDCEEPIVFSTDMSKLESVKKEKEDIQTKHNCMIEFIEQFLFRNAPAESSIPIPQKEPSDKSTIIGNLPDQIALRKKIQQTNTEKKKKYENEMISYYETLGRIRHEYYVCFANRYKSQFSDEIYNSLIGGYYPKKRYPINYTINEYPVI